VAFTKIQLQSFILFLITVLVVAALPMPVNAQSGVTATVTTGTVNIRSAPGLSTNQISAAHQGDVFTVVARAHADNRVWYQIILPSGGKGWVSERVVTIDPSPDSLPWFGEEPNENIPLAMDCGLFPPILMVGSLGQVTTDNGLTITDDAGLGKAVLGTVKLNEIFSVVDGPFCTRLAENFYQIQWYVKTGSGLEGYLLEGRPDGKGNYISYTQLSGESDAITGVETDRPNKLKDDDITEVMGIFQNAQTGDMEYDEVQSALEDFVDRLGTASLAWIVRRVPIYDGKRGQWMSFARYENKHIMNFDFSSELDNDPVNTTLNILYGNYPDDDHLFMSIGCGG
jgi:hypothetical protein